MTIDVPSEFEWFVTLTHEETNKVTEKDLLLHISALPSKKTLVIDCFRWRLNSAYSDTQSVKILKIYEQTGLPVMAITTTVADVEQCLHNVSGFYIPGDFSRQGDLLNCVALNAIKYNKRVLLERGAFLTPNDILLGVEKMVTAGLPQNQITIVDAGFSLGYSDRVLDPRCLWIYQKRNAKFAVHLNLLNENFKPYSPQRPGWLQEWNFSQPLLYTALALNAQGAVIGINQFDHY